MANTISSNMNLIIPGIGTEASPTWASDLNASLTLIDQHDHSAGSGVQITPSGLNINSSLTMNNQSLINIAALTLAAQSVTPANASLYRSGNDLYYVNGAGLAIQMTNSSGIVGSPGTISGISGNASASYSSPTFFWRSNTGIAANMDFAAAVMRNISPNSTYSVTLQPAASLAADTTLTLPSVPSALSFLQIASDGSMSPGPLLSGGITSSMISSSGLTISTLTTTGAIVVGSSITAATALIGGYVPAVATAYSGPLGIYQGRVSISGTVTAGEGFTPQIMSTGLYRILWTGAGFSATPAVVASLEAAGGVAGEISVDSTTLGNAGVYVYTRDSAGTLANAAFNFIAIGHRA